MNLILISIFVSFILARTEYFNFISSSIYKNGNMYIYESLNEYVLGTGLYVYTLKDGPISDIKPNIVNITNTDTSYTPLFLDLPPGLPNGRSDQLWMLSALHESVIKNQDLDEEHWTAQIVNDNELKFGSGLISKPGYKNFPKSGFTATIVKNDNNPTLHVIGGLIYSKELKNELITNYHFKYEFNTDKWSDLSKFTKSILPPVTYHKVIQADNSLILVTGYSQDYAKNGNFTHTLPSENSTQTNITDIYKFDLSKQKWSVEKAKINLEEYMYKQGLTYGLSLDIYNGKIISYMSLYDFWNNEHKPMLATLDYKAKEWEWDFIDVKTEAGMLNTLELNYHCTVIINDQLLMFHGAVNQGLGKKMYALDLKENKFLGSVNISGKYGQETTSSLPTWSKILISVICVAVFILILVGVWFFYRYKKYFNPNDKSKLKMQEIWASSGAEASGNNKGIATLNLGNRNTHDGKTPTIFNDDAMMGYGFFQHDVELEDMEKTKIPTKD